MLPASLAAGVPVFMATPTSAWASAGASLVPSPVMATSLPPPCSARISSILRLGRGLGQEVVDPGLAGDGGRRERVVAGDHDGADAHAPELVEAVAHAPLDDVLEVDDAEGAVAVGHHQRRAAAAGDVVDDLVELARHVPAVLLDPGHDGVGRPLADLRGRRGPPRSSGSGR